MYYAGFLKRFAAFIIDNLIISLFCHLVAFVLGINLFVMLQHIEEEYMILNTIYALIKMFFVGFITQWLYHAIFESSHWQGSLGKQALGIIVTDENGLRISFARATCRYLCKYISSVLNIGYIMAAFTSKKQGLHDLITDCLVVNKNAIPEEEHVI